MHLPKDLASAATTGLLTLKDVLTLQDSLRRLYVPYWELDLSRAAETDRPYRPGHTVGNVEWTCCRNTNEFKQLTRSETPPKDSLDWEGGIQSTRELKTPALLPWWRELLEPLT
jgi:hypothetical protein